MTLLLALYYYPNNPITGTVLLPTITTNNCAYIPTINRLTDRQALYLTTITTATGTVLPPK